MAITLILGGARSGKSRRAEALAKASLLPVCYIATAPLISGDEEWQERILRHRNQRPTGWQTIEQPLLLAETLSGMNQTDSCLLVDCMTLWLNNVLYAGLDTEQEFKKLCEVLSASVAEVILVSNEVGLGLVPEHPLGRSFRDGQGLLNQQLAQVADRVEFIAAGLPLVLK